MKKTNDDDNKTCQRCGIPSARRDAALCSDCHAQYEINGLVGGSALRIYCAMVSGLCSQDVNTVAKIAMDDAVLKCAIGAAERLEELLRQRAGRDRTAVKAE